MKKKNNELDLQVQAISWGTINREKIRIIRPNRKAGNAIR